MLGAGKIEGFALLAILLAAARSMLDFVGARLLADFARAALFSAALPVFGIFCPAFEKVGPAGA